MINMLLLKISKTKSVFYMEKKTYKDMKIYKSYTITINKKKEEFRNKKDLLIYLSKLKQVILLIKDKRVKLTDKDKKNIIADYVECQNYSEVARKYNISDTAVKKIVDNDKDSLVKLEQKKEENIKSTLEYMEEQHEVKKRLLDKLLKGMEVKAEEIDMFTNIKDLATAYGIILDKELKLKEINQKLNENTSFENINAMITNIATLINSPVSNRTEDNLDE